MDTVVPAGADPAGVARRRDDQRRDRKHSPGSGQEYAYARFIGTAATGLASPPSWPHQQVVLRASASRISKLTGLCSRPVIDRSRVVHADDVRMGKFER